MLLSPSGEKANPSTALSHNRHRVEPVEAHLQRDPNVWVLRVVVHDEGSSGDFGPARRPPKGRRVSALWPRP